MALFSASLAGYLPSDILMFSTAMSQEYEKQCFPQPISNTNLGFSKSKIPINLYIFVNVPKFPFD